MKRILAFICIFLLIIIASIGGLLAVRKLTSMYKNIWDTLDNITEMVDSVHDADMPRISRDIDLLYTKLGSLSEQVNHLHRQTFYSSASMQPEYDYSWVSSSCPYIAHACGGIEGITYTNSREAFIHNYELGHRIFEIDFNLSEDGILIASHDKDKWQKMTGGNHPYTTEYFNQLPLLGSYESLTCNEVIELLATYPDAYVVTDTKDTTKNEVMLAFSQLVHSAMKTHPETLERIIPQIYNKEMLSWISSIHPFRSVIFTLYQLNWTPEDILDYCMNSGVRFITIPQYLVTEDVLRLWDTVNIHIGVHTVNDPESISSLLDMGVDMIYTDFAVPN